MAYKSGVYANSPMANDRVNRLFAEINALSHHDLRALRDKLNGCTEPDYDARRTAIPPNTETKEPTLRLDGLCVRVLSRRELDVLTLVAAGYSRKEIGESLAITSNTAAKHVSSIYRKLNISTIAEATRIAMENGVIASNTTSA